MHHGVVIVGAGQAGISVAARLRRDGVDDIAILDPRTVHSYRPLLSYVGGGQASLDQLRRRQSSVIPRGVTWYPQLVLEVDPNQLTVRTESGLTVRGDDLIICPGLRPDWDAVPGSAEAVASGYGCSNYGDEPDSADRTWQRIQHLNAGRAVFAVAAGPIPCAGAALKPLFMAAEHWRRTRVLDRIDITAVIGWDTIFGIEELDDQLHQAAERYNITVITATDLTAIDPINRTLTLQHRQLDPDRPNTGTDSDGDCGGDSNSDADQRSRTSSRQFDRSDISALGYDLLHLVPVHRGHQWVTDSGLAVQAPALPAAADPPSHTRAPAATAICYQAAVEAVGMVDINPQTLAHNRYPRIWGLGDAAAVAASRSGGALRKQAAVVAVNLQQQRRNKPQVTYNGYSTAPITVSRGQLVLGEFDRRLRLDPSIPVVDLTKTRRLTWLYDRFLQPYLYWHSILKGRIKP